MVSIIDYGLGNLASVAKAFSSLGAKTIITSNPEKIRKSDKIVLPGQGAFNDGINNLKALGLVQLLTDEVMNRKKPFWGICLGLQLLAESGLENGKHSGLGWIKGSVVKLSAPAGLRLPHVGWDNVSYLKQSKLFTGIPNDSDFYFVHSYYLKPTDKKNINATCDYGQIFPAAFESENIYATLFHPEKSQQFGQQLIKNFLSLA